MTVTIFLFIMAAIGACLAALYFSDETYHPCNGCFSSFSVEGASCRGECPDYQDWVNKN